MNTELKEAIQTIVRWETLPSQIDYISNADLARVNKAWKVVNNLPLHLQKEVEQDIERQVDEYYTPQFKGENGEMLSVSDLDNMF